ncbi:hypothetical protein FOCC_FOCC008974 [Frankliniella occidentalis]|nr:hypothetical protein FOCC_FOCC008974 [Frankliniella occidentalis]
MNEPLAPPQAAVVAEWLRRLTRNQFPSGSTQQTQKAASAVFTILSHDPNNEIMKHNLKYYLAKPGIDVNSIVNYESEKFVSLYTLGTEAYFKEEYDAAISNLEASLKEFFKASDECRADCEGPFDQGWLPDFTSSIANHFVYCLKCKAKCQSKLSVLNGEKYDDFLATHFNYLQFAYYKKGNLREACAAAGTYLLFLPGDSTMLENVEYYKTLPKVDDSMFRPRADAEKYIKRQSYEESLLTYISDEFVFEENEDTNEIPHAEEIYKDRGGDVIIKNGTPQSLPWATAHKTLTKIHLEPVNLNQDIAHKSSMLEEKRLMLGKNQKVEGNSAENKIEKKSELNSSFEQLMNQLRRMTDRPIYNLRKEDELGGIRRFVIDGLAEENECERLIQFAKASLNKNIGKKTHLGVFDYLPRVRLQLPNILYPFQASGVSGDGYGGNKSPHSSQENFEGVTLGRAALMMNFGLIERSVLHLFLSLSERGRNMIAAYFNIPNKNLYFSYTHLVCRSAKPGLLITSIIGGTLAGEFFNSSQYSHEIHADNCWLSKNGDCMKADPAYYWRDYSALIYLNNNFKGGEFLFSADAYGNHIQSTIQPKCGRLVGFSSGIENLHGVRGVEQGSRCALALWFTLDSQRAEWGRALTEEVVHDIENGKEPEPEILHNLQKLVRFDLAQAQSQLLYKSSEQDGSMSDTHQDNFTVR